MEPWRLVFLAIVSLRRLIRKSWALGIGGENLAVGIIHRLSGGGRLRRLVSRAANVPADGAPGGVTHDSQAESYLIVSGGGTLVTGGHIINGTWYARDNDVTRVLNGPSCSGTIGGADVVKRVVKTGDIIIIPAGVPHAWIDVPDHVDYLSFRPSDHVLEAGYVHPSIRK